MNKCLFYFSKALAKAILQNVQSLVPKVQRYAAMYDEEQERELEQELEEECQNERPPAAIAEKPFVSEGLQRLANALKSGHRNLNTAGSFTPLGDALAGTESHKEHRLTFPSSTIYVTKAFATTVRDQAGDSYLKTPDFCVRWKEQGAKICTLVVSNYEAEKCFANSGHLYAFSPRVRLAQDPTFLEDKGLPDTEPQYAALHAFAGSVYAEPVLLSQTLSYFSLLPRENRLFSQFLAKEWVRPDLFVFSEEGRAALGSAYEESPYAESPVRALRLFYSQSRYLSAELATSSVGKLLGCDDLS